MHMSVDFEQHPADTPFHRRLVYGERPDGAWMTHGPANAYESVVMRPLEPMLVPEKPRNGELDPENCGSCKPDEHTIWHDDLWQVRADGSRAGFRSSGRSPRASTGCSKTLPSRSLPRSGR
jgi:hypothetical protein